MAADEASCALGIELVAARSAVRFGRHGLYAFPVRRGDDAIAEFRCQGATAKSSP